MSDRSWYFRLRRLWSKAWEAVPWARRLVNDLGRIELVDRSTALGAQALLALIPLMMSLGVLAPTTWSSGIVDQVREVIGVRDETMRPLQDAVMSNALAHTETGYASLVIGILSASSFSRAMQRMYVRAWDLPKRTGLRAIGVGILWLVGWLAMLQIAAALVQSISGIAQAHLFHLILHAVFQTLLWWWTARLLLDRRISWSRLLPGAVLTGISIVALAQVSRLFMPAFTSANLAQFGPLGVVFSIGSWLVILGGVLVVAAVIGRLVSDLWQPRLVARTKGAGM